MLDSVILWFDYEVDNLDNDWATLLVGLCLKVPGLQFSRDDHHNKCQTFGAPLSNYNHEDRRWPMMLDNETVPYSNLWYDMILLYADEFSNQFNDFNLPNEPVQPAVENLLSDKVEQNKSWQLVSSHEQWNEDAHMIELIPYIGDNEDFDVTFIFVDEQQRCLYH